VERYKNEHIFILGKLPTAHPALIQAILALRAEHVSLAGGQMAFMKFAWLKNNLTKPCQYALRGLVAQLAT
jgi:hypothetical protein